MWHHFSVVARPIWNSLLYNVKFSIRWVPMEAKLFKSHQIKSKNLQPDPKVFQEILVWSCCVASFFCRYPANLTFLALQCPIFNQMNTHGSQTSQITPNWNKKSLTRSKDLSENFSLKLMCDVIFLSLPDQSDIPRFTISNFQSDENPWKPNFSNYTKLKQKISD